MKICLVFWLALLLAAPSAMAAPPNIVIILADDLGWADLGCYGNTYNESPHLDRLAAEGLRFTQFYAGPVCSPTRANLQSGQDQARFGITQHIPGHKRPFAKLSDPPVPLQLPLEVETFAERLAAAGYRTGYFGKWHLGGANYGPDKQGWQTVIECKGHDTPPAVSGRAETVRTAEFLTDKAIEFIDQHQDGPFLVQVSHYAVHIPLNSTPERLARFKDKPTAPGYPSRPEYAALLSELDDSVGRIADHIDKLGLGENTLIVFFSDNGGIEHEQNGTIVTSNQPLNGEKGTLYEGGIRVPAVLRWTGVIAPGSVSNTPAISYDLYPTFQELAGVSTPAGAILDGVSLAALIKDPAATLARDRLYWHLPHYHHSTPASAMRQGDWKLIEFFEDDRLELYDLAADPGERTNLAAKEPQRAASMQSSLAEWRASVNARMPVPNPDYDPARAGQLAGKLGEKDREKKGKGK